MRRGAAIVLIAFLGVIFATIEMTLPVSSWAARRASGPRKASTGTPLDFTLSELTAGLVQTGRR